jgi:hypothetical protein
MNEESKDPEKIHANVLFGEGTLIAVTGIIGGVALALGFPWVVLAHGQGLGSTLLVVFVLGGLLLGGLVALTSAFFGLVMPRQVGGGAPGGLNDWIRWGMECKKWGEKDWADGADWAEPDYQNWTLEDWKAWGGRMKEKYKRS